MAKDTGHLKIPSTCKQFKHSAWVQTCYSWTQEGCRTARRKFFQRNTERRNLNSMMEQSESYRCQGVFLYEEKFQCNQSAKGRSTTHLMWVTTLPVHRPSKSCTAAQITSSIQTYSFNNLSESLAAALTLCMGLNLHPS